MAVAPSTLLTSLRTFHLKVVNAPASAPFGWDVKAPGPRSGESPTPPVSAAALSYADDRRRSQSARLRCEVIGYAFSSPQPGF
jgi:hypothetical protein